MKAFIDKLALVEIKNKKVLAARTHNTDVWYLPGGKREPGETDQQALMREVLEEIGVALLPDTIKYYGTFEAPAYGKPEGTMVKITYYTAKYEGTPHASSEIAEIGYFGYDGFPKTSISGHLVLDDLKEKGLIE